MMVELVSVVVAIASFVVAICFGRKSQRLQQQNACLQKRLLEIEESKERDRRKATSKALLRGRIENYGPSHYRLVIENTGDSFARNICLKLDGKLFDDHPAAVSGEGAIGTIGAHSEATRLLALTFACAPPFDFEISWEDDSHEPGYYRTTLTF